MIDFSYQYVFQIEGVSSALPISLSRVYSGYHFTLV